MRVEELVCTFESSKKLKELGVKQESLFYHTYYPMNNVTGDILYYTELHENLECEVYSAFTYAELIPCVPEEIKVTQVDSDHTWYEKLEITYYFGENKKHIIERYQPYNFRPEDTYSFVGMSTNLAEILAITLCYLLNPPLTEKLEYNVRIPLSYVNKMLGGSE